MPPSIWVLDPSQSTVGFSVRHILITIVNGGFPASEARIKTENGSFATATIHFKAETKSLTTNNKERDHDLKKAIFFNVKKFPYLLFESTSIAKNEAGDYTILGDLTVKGRTHSIELLATFVIPPFEPGSTPIANVTFSGKKSSLGRGNLQS